MAVRAKFKVGSKNPSLYNVHTGVDEYNKSVFEEKEVVGISFYPVTGESAENKAFFASTPSGTIELNVVNKAAADQFEVGKEYYIDFTEAKEA